MGKFEFLCRWLIILALWQPAMALAETPSPPAEINCSIANPYKGALFATLYKDTEKTAKALCSAIVAYRFQGRTSIDTASILADFAKRSEESLDRLHLNKAANYRAQFSTLKDTFNAFQIRSTAKLPEFIVQTRTGTVEAYFQPLKNQTPRFNIIESEECKNLLPQDSSCKKVFDEFQNAFNPYRSAYNNVYNNDELLAKLAGQWDKFLDASKSQTFLEVWLTTGWFEWGWFGLNKTPHFKKDYLVGPPPYQMVALHPQLIYDFSTKSSTQNEVGLAVEWIGVNFWNWKVPVGASFTTAYVSRSGVNDFGHGVMLHLFNSYAAGWARHGSVDTFYVTIDLLKAVQSKKSQYDKYMNYL